MPPAFWDDASEPTAKDRSRQMDPLTHKRRAVEPQPPAICPTDDETPMPKKRMPDKPPPLCPTDGDAILPRKQIDKQSWDYVWRSGVAGGMAGCAAKSLVAPLDRVKILFQASNPQFAKYTGSWFGVAGAMRDIFRSEGTFGLYRGHSATILRIFPYAAIKFVAYEQIRNVVIPSKDKETPIRRLVSGSLAGVTSVFFTYPLEVIRVRLAFETRKDQPRASLSSIVKRIYNEHPPAPSPPPSISTLPATSAATQTLQSAARATVESVQQITPRAGLANFYRGFSATIMGMLPYAGMSFLTHDTAQDILRSPLLSPYTTLPPSSPLRQSQDPHKPPPLRTYAELTAGGLAGLVSQTASYPLEVVRRRMQVGGAVGDGRRLTVREVGRRIWRERGWRGYWVGLSIGYVKVVPMVAVSFWVYERGKGWLGI